MNAEEIIELLGQHQVACYVRREGRVEPADPVTLSANLLPIRGLLLQLVDKVAEAELDYRRSKAAKYDAIVAEGVRPSPARDQLDLDGDLAEKKVATERLRNYMKYTDGLCTSIQSTLKVQTSSEKANY